MKIYIKFLIQNIVLVWKVLPQKVSKMFVEKINLPIQSSSIYFLWQLPQNLRPSDHSLSIFLFHLARLRFNFDSTTLFCGDSATSSQGLIYSLQRFSVSFHSSLVVGGAGFWLPRLSLRAKTEAKPPTPTNFFPPNHVSCFVC